MFWWAKNLESRALNFVGEAIQLLTKESKGGLVMYPSGREYLINQGDILRYEFITSSIEDMLETNQNLSEVTKFRIINDTLISIKKKRLAYKSFLNIVQDKYQEAISKPTKWMYVGSHVSLDAQKFTKPLDFYFEGARIRVCPSRPKILKQREIFISGFGDVPNEAPPRWAYMYTKAVGVDEDEAVEKAARRLETVRSVLNFVVNIDSKNINLGAPRPKNKIVVPKYQFIFDQQGNPSDRRIIWHPSHPGAEQIQEFRFQSNRFFDAVRFSWNRIHENSMKEELLYVLRLYCEALDETEDMQCLIKLWTAAEALTKSQDTKAIAHRLSYIHEHPDHHKENILSIGRIRHRWIHHMRRKQEIQAAIIFLRDYIEKFIVFILEFRHGHGDLHALCRALDEPVSLTALHEKQARLSLALKIRERT
mgnify:CR=1 FL=1